MSEEKEQDNIRENLEFTEEWFDYGFNCAQAVLLTNAQKLGFSQDQCLKIAAGFGGGMACLQKTCGAVTGAIMAIGAKYGHHCINDTKSKEKTYELVMVIICLPYWLKNFMDRDIFWEMPW